MGDSPPVRPSLWRSAKAAVILCGLLGAMPGRAATWIEQAQAELTCTGLASADERLALDAPWLPTPVNAATVTSYFRGAARNARQAEFRYLTILSALAWWADLINDQVLATSLYADIGLRADRRAAGGDLLATQVSRCARARVIDSQLELGDAEAVTAIGRDLARRYPAGLPVQAVTDWPLLLGVRALRVPLDPIVRVDELTARVRAYAGSASAAGQSARAGRLLAALGGGPLSPTDREAAFESLLEQARQAEARKQYDEMARLQASAFHLVADFSKLDRHSLRFYRHALGQLAGARDDVLGAVAARDPQFASRTLATYTGLYDTALAQSQAQFVADARDQLLFQFKLDNVLQALAQLQPAMPRSAADIADTTFKIAQLRSYGRLTLATLAAELARSPIDPAARFSVERYFTLSTQSAVWLRKLYDSVRVAPDAPPPAGDGIWNVFFTLDVFSEETTRQFDRFAALVKQKAPRVAELATPRPLPAREFQRRLRTGEALVATIVTPGELYVWAVTAKGVTFVRQRVTERELAEKVRRLRASLTPRGGADGSATLPPFDAAAAHEIYRLVFAPVSSALAGITDVVWFGHGPLSAVPPAVLVAAPPPKALLSTAADFAATRFLVDRYAFAVLADLSLFPWHRDRALERGPGGSFLGVGAPLLSTEEVTGGPRARSYELAGGLDGRQLAELPKLAESVDEMKGLAAVAGTDRSTLWLGPDATEQRFAGDALRGYRTIALATHGFLPNEVRDVPEPALMLALPTSSGDRYDGLLTSREIAALKLDADLVILSACNTAAGDGRPHGEAFTGLSQAFFTAGARSLMVSHWPVMSGAATALTVATFEQANRPGGSLSRGLQQAMQSARAAGAASALESHPSYWGPFVIVGDGR
jgi:CHAT domain-containing protein